MSSEIFQTIKSVQLSALAVVSVDITPNYMCKGLFVYLLGGSNALNVDWILYQDATNISDGNIGGPTPNWLVSDTSAIYPSKHPNLHLEFTNNDASVKNIIIHIIMPRAFRTR